MPPAHPFPFAAGSASLPAPQKENAPALRKLFHVKQSAKWAFTNGCIRRRNVIQRRHRCKAAISHPGTQPRSRFRCSRLQARFVGQKRQCIAEGIRRSLRCCSTFSDAQAARRATSRPAASMPHERDRRSLHGMQHILRCTSRPPRKAPAKVPLHPSRRTSSRKRKPTETDADLRRIH